MVTDPSGAVVQAASLKIVSRATGAERSVVTNSVGEYSAPNFNPAEYSMEIQKQRFASASQSSVQLLARQVAKSTNWR